MGYDYSTISCLSHPISQNQCFLNLPACFLSFPLNSTLCFFLFFKAVAEWFIQNCLILMELDLTLSSLLCLLFIHLVFYCGYRFGCLILIFPGESFPYSYTSQRYYHARSLADHKGHEKVSSKRSNLGFIHTLAHGSSAYMYKTKWVDL